MQHHVVLDIIRTASKMKDCILFWNCDLRRFSVSQNWLQSKARGPHASLRTRLRKRERVGMRASEKSDPDIQ
jgi:hypothetical protein